MSLQDIKDREKIDRKRAVGDNMNGEKRAEEKLDMRKVDVFNLRDYLKYKDAIQNDKDLKDVFPGDYPIKQLLLLKEEAERKGDTDKIKEIESELFKMKSYLNDNNRFNIPICCKLCWWFNIEQRCVLYATR